ncbi:MAG: carbohydrate binding family 9 domain-containing protein [Bacteroidales bacterium]|nr:carbohydrate binding family 9 domain-containing protein [Bacteroidales bacterium]
MPGIYLSLFTIILLCSNTILYSQPKGINREKYQIKISETNSTINIDGILDEPAWQTADRANNFQRVIPTDTGFAVAQTEVKLTYTKSTLYIGIVCLDPLPGRRPVESLRRDFAFMKNDNFVVFIDTYNDQTNGFAFGISPAGAQWDGQQANGGTVNLDWDIKWRSAVKSYDDRWVAEFAIPFRSMRYNGGAREWGINFSRQDFKTGEKSSWAPMPRQFATANLAYTGSLVWDKPLLSSGLRFSVIPYILGKTTQDKEAGEGFKPEVNAGADAKVILSTSMNLDLTVNPDYSQIEVDKQRTNLDRFELFFPEKRQFYLENSDLFANLGSDYLRPFFSRRIGLNSPVQAGARLSGKIGNNWRIGIMDMQTDEKDDIRAGNYSVAAIQRKVFSRSNISAFLVNKEVTNLHNDTSFTGYKYNRVAGLEYNLASADNRWTGKAFYHQSFYPGASGDASVMAANITYATQYMTAKLNQSWVGSDYLAEVGYIRRTGYYEVTPSYQYKFFPASSRIANHGPIVTADMLFDTSLDLTDREVQLSYQIEWMNKSVFQIDLEDSYILLQNPFDPTNTGGDSLKTNTGYNWNEIGASFTSDIRKPFNFLISGLYGGYYNGARLTLNGELYYRIQPYSSLAIVTSYNKLDMPSPYRSAKFLLIGPRLDVTFTDKLFFTSLVQYNNQIDNLNLNLRFQWRFAPVSDLYIVYTENSYPTDYRVRNRGLVLKMSYWFN